MLSSCQTELGRLDRWTKLTSGLEMVTTLSLLEIVLPLVEDKVAEVMTLSSCQIFLVMPNFMEGLATILCWLLQRTKQQTIRDPATCNFSEGKVTTNLKALTKQIHLSSKEAAAMIK